MLPITFTDNRRGLIEFGAAIFHTGQITAAQSRYDVADLLPSIKSVRTAVQDLSAGVRSEFKSEILYRVLHFSSGMTRRKRAYFSVTVTVWKPRSDRLEVGQCRDDRPSTIRLAMRQESLVPFCVCYDAAV